MPYRYLTLIAALAVTACVEAPVPDSGAGVGFGDYANFELERARNEAALRGLPQRGPLATPAGGGVSTGDLAAAGIGGSTGAGGGGPIGAPLSALGPVGETEAQRNQRLANNPEISDEQSFDAVASRETIESDAARRQQQAETLLVVDAVPLPTTRSNTGPNIVQYAINAPNRKGQEWYSRSVLSGDSRFQRNCATYTNADAAQRDFLTRGGPERDQRGIDPDGDGFACGWDPAPFRLASGN